MEQRCFKRVPGDNRGVSQFYVNLSNRAFIACVVATLDYEDPVQNSDGITLQSRHTKPGSNPFTCGIVHEHDLSSGAIMWGTPMRSFQHALLWATSQNRR